MLCFKDMTFCSAVCDNKTCFRQFTKEEQEASEKWWDHDPDNAPVAFSDFSKNCDEYVMPTNFN